MRFIKTQKSGTGDFSPSVSCHNGRHCRNLVKVNRGMESRTRFVCKISICEKMKEIYVLKLQKQSEWSGYLNLTTNMQNEKVSIIKRVVEGILDNRTSSP
jgi:hypothetical protein